MFSGGGLLINSEQVQPSLELEVLTYQTKQGLYHNFTFTTVAESCDVLDTICYLSES